MTPRERLNKLLQANPNISVQRGREGFMFIHQGNLQFEAHQINEDSGQTDFRAAIEITNTAKGSMQRIGELLLRPHDDAGKHYSRVEVRPANTKQSIDSAEAIRTVKIGLQIFDAFTQTPEQDRRLFTGRVSDKLEGISQTSDTLQGSGIPSGRAEMFINDFTVAGITMANTWKGIRNLINRQPITLDD